jgi:hypothetical protein
MIFHKIVPRWSVLLIRLFSGSLAGLIFVFLVALSPACDAANEFSVEEDMLKWARVIVSQFCVIDPKNRR